MERCILLGKDAGRDLTDSKLEFRVRIGDNSIIGTTVSEIEYAIIHAVVCRSVEKKFK